MFSLFTQHSNSTEVALHLSIMFKQKSKFVLWLVDTIVFGLFLSSLVTILDIWSAMQMFWGRGEMGEVQGEQVQVSA